MCTTPAEAHSVPLSNTKPAKLIKHNIKSTSQIKKVYSTKSEENTPLATSQSSNALSNNFPNIELDIKNLFVRSQIDRAPKVKCPVQVIGVLRDR